MIHDLGAGLVDLAASASAAQLGIASYDFLGLECGKDTEAIVKGLVDYLNQTAADSKFVESCATYQCQSNFLNCLKSGPASIFSIFTMAYMERGISLTHPSFQANHEILST